VDDDRIELLVDVDIFDDRLLVDADDPAPYVGSEQRRSPPGSLGLLPSPKR